MKKLKIAMLLLAIALNFTLAYGQWSLTGNASTNPPTNFLGTTDQKPLVFKVNGLLSGLIDYDANKANTVLGHQSLISLTTGAYNVALGYTALFANTSGGGNTACGVSALGSTTTAWNSSAFGAYTLANNTGNDNAGFGTSSLYNNTTGERNVATGFRALYTNSNGNNNTAIGYKALFYNTASESTALGYQALYSNSSGTGNTAAGYNALYTNDDGDNNTATGYEALNLNVSGSNNTAMGYAALNSNYYGDDNTALGVSALPNNFSGSHNTAVGYGALTYTTNGEYVTGLGYRATVSVSTPVAGNATALGANAVVNNSDKVRIGDVNVSVIEGQVAYSWPSDSRFKMNIKEEDIKGLEFIKLLRPVAYNFDTKKFEEFLTKGMPDSIRQKQLNRNFTGSTNIRHSGFIAQEVEKAADKVDYNFDAIHKPSNDNDNYSLAYSQFVVPLVKAVQELSAENDKKGSAIADLNKKVEELQSQLNKILKELGKTTNTKRAQQIAGKESYLEQNSPNPFNVDTKIRYQLPQSAVNPSLLITNMSGQVLKTISLQNKGGEVIIAGKELTPGIYFYSLIVNGNKADTKQMVITQ